jgi:hypothetical protein
MALSIDPATSTVTIPQADLTYSSGTLYDFDTLQFMRDLNALLDDEEYIWMNTAFSHNTEVIISGVPYARLIEMLSPWSITFEDTGSAYSVRYINSNNNMFDVDSGRLNPTALVTVISQNSAGLTSSSVDATNIWGALLTDHTNSGTFGWFVQRLLTFGKWIGLRGGPGK